MLRELHISNLAVIADVTVELTDGLNVFTGQTGAGKSLIIGAFELLLGLRSGGSDAGGMIRSGCEEARVSGLFEIRDESMRCEIARIFDRTFEPGEPLLITRRLFASGRSSVSINGAPATAGMLRQAGEYLVDIHGQSDQQYLLRPAHQLSILDAFAGLDEQRNAFAAACEELRRLRKRRRELLSSAERRRQQIELWEFQIEEIDAAAPQPGEFEQVRSRFKRLSNIGKLSQDVGQVHEALGGDDAVLERLGLINKWMGELIDLDPGKLTAPSRSIADATEQLRDSAYALAGYVDDLELNPGELEEAQQRLDTLNHLIHKYARDATGDDPLAAVIGYRQQIGRSLQEMQSDEADLDELDRRESQQIRTLAEIGSTLSSARRRAAKKLKPLIETELGELGMSEATFDVECTTSPADSEEIGPSGLDRIEFLIRTNPGQEARPLRRIASGGEISRIMLAMKSILADNERISVLVFDEIDANIGGRLGSVIGRKMRKLTGDSGRQVLCITHLPQIAAFANHHLRISKDVTGKGRHRQTTTTVGVLDGDDRLTELAEMLAGKNYTPTALDQAGELLQTARE